LPTEQVGQVDTEIDLERSDSFAVSKVGDQKEHGLVGSRWVIKAERIHDGW
jgi:hypothetical protein